MSKVRLAVVLSHPVQYYSPWLREIARSSEIDLRVFYLWNFGVTAQRDPLFGQVFQWDIDLLSGYDSELVPNVARDPGTHHFGGLDNPTLTARLGAWRPHAVLMFGYAWKSMLRTLLWARRRDIPVLLRGDSHWLGRPVPRGPRLWLTRLLFRQFSAFLTVGQANRDYYRQAGVPEDRLFFAPHAVEAARFNPSDDEARRRASELRRDLGLTSHRVLLFAGKFHSGKQPVELLRAFRAVATERDALVFVGDGPQRSELESLAASPGKGLVRFLPFANQSEMPSRYFIGDVFILPSRGAYETWGLAVNEAMHLERPCIVSDLVGCNLDLIEPGVTGWRFPAHDTSALAQTIRKVLDLPAEELSRVGQRASARVANYSFARATAGLNQALQNLLRPPCA